MVTRDMAHSPAWVEAPYCGWCEQYVHPDDWDPSATSMGACVDCVWERAADGAR